MTGSSAAVLVEPRRIELRSFPLPRINGDDALLRVEATGICGSDWAPYSGQWMPVTAAPMILGHEVVGEVVEIGPEARRRWSVDVGDRLVIEESIPCGSCPLCRTNRPHMCDPIHTANGMRYGLTPVDVSPHLWGGLSEYMYLHPRAVVHRISPSVPATLAPLFIPLSNGIRWLQDDGNCRIGDTVAIFGPGQHGLGCVLGARLAGAGTIIVVGTNADQNRLKVATTLGADHVIQVEDGSAAEQILNLTNGAGADVVIEVTSGAPGVLAQAVGAARVGATVVVAGLHEMRPATHFLSDELVLKEITVRGVYGHDWLSVSKAIEILESDRYPLAELCTHTFSLGDADQALRTLGGEGDTDPIHVTVVPEHIPASDYRIT